MGGMLCFCPNPILLLSCRRRVAMSPRGVRLSFSLCKLNKRSFPEHVSTLPASPLSGFRLMLQHCVVALFVRSTYSSVGSMRPLDCGMRSRPYWLSLHHYLNVVACLPLILSTGCFSSLFCPTSSRSPKGFCYRWLSRANDAYDSTSPSENSTASASMNALSCERSVPLDATANAVARTNLLVTAEDLPPTYARRTSIAVPSTRWLAAPTTRTERNVCRLSPIRSRKWIWGFEVICTGVSARFS